MKSWQKKQCIPVMEPMNTRSGGASAAGRCEESTSNGGVDVIVISSAPLNSTCAAAAFDGECKIDKGRTCDVDGALGTTIDVVCPTGVVSGDGAGSARSFDGHVVWPESTQLR